MHTVVILICGFALFGIFLAFGWLWHLGPFPSELTTKSFIAVWVIIAFINMWTDINKAGYAFSEELSVLPFVLLPPVIAAGFVLFLW